MAARARKTGRLEGALLVIVFELGGRAGDANLFLARFCSSTD